MIELLVVVAIIAMLAAILLPALDTVRENARRASCLSNCSQIGIAALQYTQDADEYLPGFQTDNASFNAIQTWADMIYPYVKNEQTFMCPDDSGTVDNMGHHGGASIYQYATDRTVAPGNTYGYGSYAINACYSNNSRTSGANPPANDYRYDLVGLPRITVPSETVWITETWPSRYTIAWQAGVIPTIGNVYVNGATDEYMVGGGRVLFDAHNPGGVAERHNGTVNVVWCDGHAKAVPLDFLTAQSTTNLQRGVYTLKYFTIQDD